MTRTFRAAIDPHGLVHWLDGMKNTYGLARAMCGRFYVLLKTKKVTYPTCLWCVRWPRR